ncbi:hypothetical protein PMI41_01858 [Phyllobacterium sp. YR531]|nr:hypothetical protein PMI41_01858 [Phyllobacterium sp. YR531]
MTDEKDRPYLTSVWPYLLIVAALSVVSIVAGRACSERHEHGYRVPAHKDVQ